MNVNSWNYFAVAFVVIGFLSAVLFFGYEILRNIVNRCPAIITKFLRILFRCLRILIIGIVSKIIIPVLCWLKLKLYDLLFPLLYLFWLLMVLVFRPTGVGLYFYAGALIFLFLSFLFFAAIQEWMLNNQWFTEAYYEHGISAIEKQVQIITGNSSVRLNGEDRALVRLSLKPKPDRQKVLKSGIVAFAYIAVSLITSGIFSKGWSYIHERLPVFLMNLLGPFLGDNKTLPTNCQNAEQSQELLLPLMVVLPFFIVLFVAFARSLRIDKDKIVAKIYRNYLGKKS